MAGTWKRTGALILVAAIAASAGLYYLVSQPQPETPRDDLVISTGSPEFSALTLVADKAGFFEKQGLNVTLRHYPSGIGAINDLKCGTADIAYAAEFVGVSQLESTRDLRIIGTTAKCDVISLVSRNDRNITSPKDLKGKKIAVPKGTQAEFFLGRYLALNGITFSDVTIQYLSPQDLVKCVVSGDCDAGIIWEPYAFMIGDQLGNGSTTFPAQSGQWFYWVVYTRPDVVRDHPGILHKYFVALDEAGRYFYENSDESKEVVGDHLNLTEEYIDSLWHNNEYILSLDQSLIIAMEDESRWMIGSNLTSNKTVPNYLDTIEVIPLRSVNPGAVNIIR